MDIYSESKTRIHSYIRELPISLHFAWNSLFSQIFIRQFSPHDLNFSWKYHLFLNVFHKILSKIKCVPFLRITLYLSALFTFCYSFTYLKLLLFVNLYLPFNIIESPSEDELCHLCSLLVPSASNIVIWVTVNCLSCKILIKLFLH